MSRLIFMCGMASGELSWPWIHCYSWKEVMEWAALHKTELTENWGRARRQVPLDAVAPLE